MAQPEKLRPVIRYDCLHGDHKERPCPFIGCKYHLIWLFHNEQWLSQTPIYAIIKRIAKLRETCLLDVADKGPQTLQQIADIMGGISRERVRQIIDNERGALDRLRHPSRRKKLIEFTQPLRTTPILDINHRTKRYAA